MCISNRLIIKKTLSCSIHPTPYGKHHELPSTHPGTSCKKHAAHIKKGQIFDIKIVVFLNKIQFKEFNRTDWDQKILMIF